jgi:hypothetical protein
MIFNPSKRKRLKKLLKQYEQMHQHWQDKADYYFKNHSYYLGCIEIEEEYEPHFKLACENRNIFFFKIQDLERKLRFIK